MDGPGKTCSSCGAVRTYQFFFDFLCYVHFSEARDDWREKEAEKFYNSKARMNPTNRIKLAHFSGVINFFFPFHSRHLREWFLVHVEYCEYGAKEPYFIQVQFCL